MDLLEACSQGNITKVKELIKSGVNVNLKNNYSETALYRASFSGHKAIVKLLLKSNADVNVKDYYGRTVLHLASQFGHLDVVKLLIDSNAEVDDASAEYIKKHFPNHPQYIQYLKSKIF